MFCLIVQTFFLIIFFVPLHTLHPAPLFQILLLAFVSDIALDRLEVQSCLLVNGYATKSLSDILLSLEVPRPEVDAIRVSMYRLCFVFIELDMFVSFSWSCLYAPHNVSLSKQFFYIISVPVSLV